MFEEFARPDGLLLEPRTALAEVAGFDVAGAAGVLKISMSQLAKLLRHERHALAMVNEEREARGLVVVAGDVRERRLVDLGDAVVLLEHAREAAEGLPRALVTRVLAEQARVALEGAVEVLEVVLVNLPQPREVGLLLVEVVLGRGIDVGIEFDQQTNA